MFRNMNVAGHGIVRFASVQIVFGSLVLLLTINKIEEWECKLCFTYDSFQVLNPFMTGLILN